MGRKSLNSIRVNITINENLHNYFTHKIIGCSTNNSKYKIKSFSSYITELLEFAKAHPNFKYEYRKIKYDNSKLNKELKKKDKEIEKLREMLGFRNKAKTGFKIRLSQV